MFRLQDINENVLGYGNHNWAYTLRYKIGNWEEKTKTKKQKNKKQKNKKTKKKKPLLYIVGLMIIQMKQNIIRRCLLKFTICGKKKTTKR